MSRISQKDLELSIKRLNEVSKRTYILDGAYGGWKLSVQEKGTCQSDVSLGFGSKSEVYYIVQAILNYRSKENHEPI